MYWERLSESVENDYVDFKRQWYSGKTSKFDMIHDILSMSNSLSNSSDRFIVIGVAEEKLTQVKTILGVNEDSNCNTAENIIQTLRNYMPVIPKIETIRETVEEKSIDIIKITPNAWDLPYVLNKSCEYEDEKNKKHILPKNWIYSRDGSRNTPINECCNPKTLEELYARKRGEHLHIIDRFAMYLEDLTNWKRPKRYENESLTEDAFYYLKNHKFKVVIKPKDDDNYRTIYQASSYIDLLSDVPIEKDYWLYRDRIGNYCYDDHYSWFMVELWADNTLIDIFCILDLYIKYYFADKGLTRQTFYLPSREDMTRIYGFKNALDIKNTLVWRVCELLHKNHVIQGYCSEENDVSLILEHLNYEYLTNMGKYLDENDEWLYTPPKSGTSQ